MATGRGAGAANPGGAETGGLDCGAAGPFVAGTTALGGPACAGGTDVPRWAGGLGCAGRAGCAVPGLPATGPAAAGVGGFCDCNPP